MYRSTTTYILVTVPKLNISVYVKQKILLYLCFKGCTTKDDTGVLGSKIRLKMSFGLL